VRASSWLTFAGVLSLLRNRVSVRLLCGCLIKNWLMAKGFRPVDRAQRFLLPPDMADWLPADHLAWFVISVVEQLDMSGFLARRRVGGAGRAGFDPSMLLTLLIYAYACGERSSRQIERLCATDVAFRVICAQDAPDHTTIARFRQDNHHGIEALFAQVLMLCAAAGLGRVGVIAIDGTKIAGNASIGADHSAAWLREQASQILADAERVDAEEDALFADKRGDELPEDFTDPSRRGAAIKAALEALRETTEEQDAKAEAEFARLNARVQRAEAALAKALAHAQGRFDAYQRAVAEGEAGNTKALRRRKGVDPDQHWLVLDARARLAANVAKRDRWLQDAGARDAERRENTTINLTDPHSRRMLGRSGWVHGYNAQLAVSQDQLILAAALTQQPNDVGCFTPMLRAAEHAATLLGQARGAPAGIGTVLADAGYFSLENLSIPGPSRLIALGKAHRHRRAARENPATGAPPEDADPIAAMRHWLRTAEGIATYKQRATIVEPVIGHLKDRVGLRRFARRGREATQSELTLSASVLNLLKLYRASRCPA
jgi:transposase